MAIKKVIHVHQGRMRKGLPALLVRTYRGSQYFRRVEVLGPTTLVHAEEPDRCGARVWIETEADLVCDGEAFDAKRKMSQWNTQDQI